MMDIYGRWDRISMDNWILDDIRIVNMDNLDDRNRINGWIIIKIELVNL